MTQRLGGGEVEDDDKSRVESLIALAGMLVYLSFIFIFLQNGLFIYFFE